MRLSTQTPVDEQTGDLNQQNTQTGTTPITVDDQNYSYDNTGQITSDADTPSAGETQVQCYQYDYLGRLSQAWSQGSSSCASGPSQTAESGAAAGYWEQYSYNDENDMTREVSTPASGAATTTTDGYAAAGSAQPHAISAQTVATSTGSTTTNYGYNADGQLTTESGASSDSLTWDPTGQPASMTTSAGTTDYLYDASGNLLIQKDPSSTTLFLADEEITLTGSTTSGTRYYQLGGQTVAARTGAGSVYYLTGDQEGTQTLAINSTTLAVSERFYDPYGNPVGTAIGTWPGGQGFQDGTTDTATGLTNLGAREYNSGTDSFASPDPILNPTDPQDLNPYAYAGDSPPSSEDPSGAMAEYQTPTGSYVGTAQSYQTMQQDQTIPYVPSYNFQNNNPYIDGGPGRTSAGGSDGTHRVSPPVVHQAPSATSGGGGCGFMGLSCAGHFLHSAADTVGHGADLVWHETKAHWQQAAEIISLGVCTFASAGLCLVAGGLYTIASYIATVHDSGGDIFNRGALEGAGENLVATLIMGYAGKVLGGILASTSAEEVSDAFKIGKGLWSYPYLSTNIGENAIKGADTVSTSHLLLNNAFWSATGCFGSFSWPCKSA